MTMNPAAINREKTSCPQGHAYSPDNTYRTGGRRFCRTCRRAFDRRRNRDAWYEQFVRGLEKKGTQ